MAKGIQRRQLKEPDEFLTLSRRFLEYARHHEREVTLAVLGIAVVVGLALGVRWYRSWQESNAEAAFGAARHDFTELKFDSAAEGFRRVVSTWPATSHSHLALVYLGNSYAELGKTKEAEGALVPVLLEKYGDLNSGSPLAAKAGRGTSKGRDLGGVASILDPHK